MLRTVRLAFVGILLSAAAGAADTITLILNTDKGQHQLAAELADTPAERAHGLMWREDFGAGDAMLFVFPEAAPRAFWMKDTHVSLDIIFFADDGSWINTHAHTTPFSTESLPSEAPARYVLELPAGTALKLGLGEGTYLKLPE
ncbi:DUF192 domain-containing protein [Alphaproteobacteria bacterium LSUCC0684]